MAQRDQIGRLLDPHDAGEPRDRQDVALAGAAFGDQVVGGPLHGDMPRRHGLARGDGLVRDIDHMRLALRVEMRQAAHQMMPEVSGFASRLRVAVATSSARISVSPIRKERAP